jgi:hypothetical protein
VEMIVVVASFVGLALAALRWGHDSRPAPCSKEWEQASLGLVWDRDDVALGLHTRPGAARPALPTAMRVRRIDAELRAAGRECALVA